MARRTVRLIALILALAAGPVYPGMASAVEAIPAVAPPVGFTIVLEQARKTGPQWAELQRTWERAASQHRASTAERSGIVSGLSAPLVLTESRIAGGVEYRLTRALGEGELSLSLGLGAQRNWSASAQLAVAPQTTLSLRYPLGATSDLEQQQADLLWQTAQWSVVQKRREWEQTLLRNYLSYLSAQRASGVAEARLAYAEEHLRRIEAMHDAGASSSLALYDARQQLFNAEDALDAALRAEEEARITLLRAIGSDDLPAGLDDLPRRSPITADSVDLPTDLTGWQQLALELRGDIPLAEAKVELAGAALEKARSATQPHSEVQGRLAYPTASGFDAEVLFVWTMPLQQPGHQERVIQAELDLEQAEAERVATLLQVQDEVRKAYATYEAALRSIERAEEQVAHAATMLEVAESRYEQGFIPYEDVLEAVWTLARAEHGLADAEGQLLMAVVQLWHSTGKDVAW